MADLHADVARRVLAAEAVQFASRQRGERGFGSVGGDADVHLTVGEFGEGVHTGLGGCRVLAEAERSVRGERGGAECGDEDVAGPDGRIGDDSIGTLDKPGPEATPEQRVANLRVVQPGGLSDAEVHALPLAVGFDEHAEQLALLAPDDLPDRAADRRGEEDVGVLLVRHDGGAAEHGIAFLHEKSRKESLEDGRFDRHDARCCRLGDTEFCFSRYGDVQTLFQNEVF